MVFFTSSQLHVTVMEEVKACSLRIVNLSGDCKGRREYKRVKEYLQGSDYNNNLWNSKVDEGSKNEKGSVWVVGVWCIEVCDEVE